MKSNQIIAGWLALAALSTLTLQPSTGFAQGSLTPPGAPAPMMKTLAQIEPRTPISSLPFTISAPGSYYVTTNLTGASGSHGIAIAAGNVTLDLNGFSLLGLSSSLDGIHVNGTYTNITVRNGVIAGWGGTGVNAYTIGYPRDLMFERLTISANGSYGIQTEAGSEVRDCCCMSNVLDGIYSVGGLVSGCVVRDNGNNGINAHYCVVRDCQVWNNGGTGISTGHSTVSGCYVGNNVQIGIYATDGGCQIVGNNCYHNNTSGNTGAAGIDLGSSNNRIEDNHVTDSGYAGIQVGTSSLITNNIIIRNTVSGNGANNYIIPANQVTGPLINTTGTITSANPWANFSF
jgi:parallel beta-helix repeat protein